MSEILATLQRAARQHSGRVAVSGAGTYYSYQALHAAVLKAADWLVDIELPRSLFISPANEPDDVVLILASMVADRLPMIVDPVWKCPELRTIAQQTGASHLLAKKGRFDEFRPIGEESLGREIFDLGVRNSVETSRDVVVGRFTSGTTGISRCLGFTEEAVLAAAEAWSQAAALSSDDVVLCLATLNNGLAFNTSLLSVLLRGAHLALHSGRPIPSSIRRVVQETTPDVLVAFPFVFDALAKVDLETFLGLRLAVSSAAPLSTTTAKQWRHNTNVPICNYYGLAEVGPATFNRGDVAASLGRALPGADLQVALTESAEQGPIRVKTGWMAACYVDDQLPRFHERVDTEGYYLTNDIGRVVDGELFVTGRADNIVNIAGRKINPSEVASVIRGLVGVEDVVVRGEESSSSIVLAAYIESATLDRSAIIEHCRGNLADYKLPQKVVVLPKLPRTSAGKLSSTHLKNFQQGVHS